MEVTVKKIDGKLVAEIPSDQLEELNVAEGDKLVIMQTARGLKLMRKEDADDLLLAREIMEEDFDVLQRLAQ